MSDATPDADRAGNLVARIEIGILRTRLRELEAIVGTQNATTDENHKTLVAVNARALDQLEDASIRRFHDLTAASAENARLRLEVERLAKVMSAARNLLDEIGCCSEFPGHELRTSRKALRKAIDDARGVVVYKEKRQRKGR